MAKNFSNFLKSIYLYFQKDKESPLRINTKKVKSALRHIIEKILKAKEEILKTRKKITYCIEGNVSKINN